ncbi:MAG: hypothetical protein ABFE02_04975 [Sulfuricella sp.]
MFYFKGLINALLRKKNDDPVGDLKSATIWVQELPKSDIGQAQQEIIKALGSLNTNPATGLKERIRVLLYLDEKALSLQETLCREYLAAMDQPSSSAHQQIHTILQFWEEMAHGYRLCIRIFSKTGGNGDIRKQIPLLTAKAIHFCAMQAKWCHLRYLPVDPGVWRKLHRLYQFAEQENFDRTPVQLYPQQDETTCTAEYLQPMMLHLANPASLLPAQIEMVDFWLDTWAKSLVIESAFRPHRQLFAINLGDTKPARKLRRNMLGEKYRYWGVGMLLITITKVVERLKQGEMPARLKLSEDCRLPGCFELIDEVTRRWNGQGGTRKHERTAAQKTLLAVQGLGNIVAHLKGRHQAGMTATYRTQDNALDGQTIIPPSKEAELFEEAQQWQVENESLSGYGVTFHSNGAAQLKIGALISLKEATTPNLAIGIVRRINNEPPRQVHAGIQTLSQTPVLVSLHPLPGEKGRPASAIYLPELTKLQLGRSLLLPCRIYAQGKLVQLKAQGKAYTIRLQNEGERGGDYVRTGFDVVAKH